jgi:hypothetical protein
MLLVGTGGANEGCLWDGAHYHKGSIIDQLQLTPPEDGGCGSHVPVHGDTCLISAPDEFG